MQTIPLLVPHMPSTSQVIPYLERIDSNRHYTNFGPLNRELEQRIAAVLTVDGRTPHVTTVSNCTVGIELALQALGLTPGARVLLPAITFVATATAVLRAGFTPVFSDVDAAQWTLTPELAEIALAEDRIDAVLPVSTFGHTQCPDAWDAFTARHSVPVVVDAAGAFGNQNAGRTTDVVYSFHATKSFGAAEGGAVVSSSAERIASIRRLANFGIDTSIAMLVDVGTNAKMSEYHCALGLASFDMWEKTKAQRVELHTRYKAAVESVGAGVRLQDKSDAGVYPLFVVLLPEDRRAQDASRAFAAAGIETRRWYCPPLYRHPALAGAQRVRSTAIADDIGERLIGLPFFLGITDEQIDRITAVLGQIIEG